MVGNSLNSDALVGLIFLSAQYTSSSVNSATNALFISVEIDTSILDKICDKSTNPTEVKRFFKKTRG